MSKRRRVVCLDRRVVSILGMGQHLRFSIWVGWTSTRTTSPGVKKMGPECPTKMEFPTESSVGGSPHWVANCGTQLSCSPVLACFCLLSFEAEACSTPLLVGGCYTVLHFLQTILWPGSGVSVTWIDQATCGFVRCSLGLKQCSGVDPYPQGDTIATYEVMNSLQLGWSSLPGNYILVPTFDAWLHPVEGAQTPCVPRGLMTAEPRQRSLSSRSVPVRSVENCWVEKDDTLFENNVLLWKFHEIPCEVNLQKSI